MTGRNNKLAEEFLRTPAQEKLSTTLEFTKATVWFFKETEASKVIPASVISSPLLKDK